MEQDLVTLTADIVAAHVANNNVAIGDLGQLIKNVHGALSRLQEPPTPPEPERKKALVSMRASVKPDYLVCLECGSRHKMLKRHLSTAHDMTPARYRADHELPATYPMVAPNYSERRRALAHAIGLGRKPRGSRKGSGGKGASEKGGGARRAPAQQGSPGS
jgi:predicted transcriptional regulator